MERPHPLLECLFGATLGDSTAEESVSGAGSEFAATANGQIVASLESGTLRAQLEHLSGFSWTLFLTVEGQESPHTLAESAEPAVATFLSGVRYGANPSTKVQARLVITKPLGDTVQLFNPEGFFQWLNSLGIDDALNTFAQVIGNRSAVSFVHPSFTPNTSTGCFRFVSVAGQPAESVEAIKMRGDLLAARREQIVSDWSTLPLFPDDFRWKDGPEIEAIAVLFARLENFLGVVSLADNTKATETGFNLRVKSHVLREETMAWACIPQTPDVALRNLFEWCYRNSGVGPLSDKLGLVRNYISLYWEGSIFGQDLRVVAAVQAGFNMYLKRNLKEFIDLRAKVAAFLLELDAKATKAVEAATGNLEKNLYGVVTFVTSVVLIKALQDKTFAGAFSPQVAVLGWTLIGFSAMHAVFAWCSTDKEMRRATELYNDLRKLYSAFFTEAEFDSIFSTEKQAPIEKTKRHVRARLASVMIVWALTLVAATVLIFCLRAEPKDATRVQPTPNTNAASSGSQTQSPSVK
jgi:hypothetical protein